MPDTHHAPETKPDTSASSRPRRRTSIASSHSAHFVLTTKGGVGKSATARFLAEYLKQSGAPVVCADTDPNNATFASVESLGATHYPSMTGASELNGDTLNELFSRVITEESSFVIDNGSPSFTPICNYMVQSGLFDMIESCGKTAIVHAPVTAAALLDSTNALRFMIEEFPASVRFVPWINEHFGALQFTDTGFYAQFADRFLGVVRVGPKNRRLDGPVMERLLSERLTFGDVTSGTQFNLMEKLFLSVAWERIKKELSEVL